MNVLSKNQFIGAIPADWIVKPARNLGVFTGAGVDKKISDSETPVRMINYLDVYRSKNGEVNICDDLMVTTAPIEKIQSVKVNSGDILITPSSETSEDIGHAALVPEVVEDIVYSYHLTRFVPGPELVPSFTTWALNSTPIRAYLSSVCTGITRMVLSREDFKSTLIPVPSIEEQKAIASFLDRETAKIDELIQKQEKLLELLELKRQAVIYKSITKGLNSETSLRPSQIAWIGEIPSHWVAGKVKNYFEVTLGKMLQPEQKKVSDRLVSYLRAANIQLSGADISDVKEMWLSENELKELRLADGDVLVSEGGDVGRCCIWNSELDECYFQNSINRVRPIGKQSNKFFYYWMTFAKNTGYIDILCNKSTIAHLTAEKLSALPMVFPPIEEQNAIVDFLDAMFIKFDALISKSELSISFLKEHRSSLISAAVTGKIDARELV